MPILHYIHDPLCGWCYAAAPLIRAARDVPGLRIALHAGGLMIGAHRRRITPQWREFVIPHDRRIAQLTGQPFGDAYFDGLLHDTEAVMDSEPPTTAILAAESLAEKGLDMLHAVQHAHWGAGRRIAERDTLLAIAGEQGLDPAAFSVCFDAQAGAATLQHIAESRAWLARVGGQGFPTVVREGDDGVLSVLEIGPYLGKADAWREMLGQRDG